VRVCDIVRDPAAWRGKNVAVIGRFSFRENGRYMSEAACESRITTGSFTWPNSLRLSIDAKDGPKLPEGFDIDGAVADRMLKETRKATALGKFRFGSVEYDRWAVVYGRVEPSTEFASPPATLKVSKSGMEPAPLVLYYRGDGLIFFIAAE
jgi:hypothetical protein